MRKTAADLGVGCQFCHSAPRRGDPEPKKDIARRMFQMTYELTAKVQEATGNPKAKVECITCHHGVPNPKQIVDIFAQTMAEKNLTEAIAEYRDLREKYYGRQAYDFGEEALLNYGQQLSNRLPNEAIAILKLNLEYYPRSAETLAAIGYAYTRKYDDETALEYLEQAAEIDPDNGIIAGRLAQLRGYRKK
jgi:tetratricopeptide (TPR) repeat protein